MIRAAHSGPDARGQQSRGPRVTGRTEGSTRSWCPALRDGRLAPLVGDRLTGARRAGHLCPQHMAVHLGHDVERVRLRMARRRAAAFVSVQTRTATVALALEKSSSDTVRAPSEP